MHLIKKRKVCDGVYWVEIPSVNLYILCGCPADSIKHLIKKGLVQTTKRGDTQFQTGPNAILLSDTLIQEGNLSNLSEFPLLHMFYNQGMIVPDHPNNTGKKPYLIGKKEFVQSQMDYLFRGNYGLGTEEEYKNLGVSDTFIKENISIKLRFAYGKFAPSAELINPIFLSNQEKEIKDGVTIKRLELNVFEIGFKGKSIKIDLNLRKYQKYQPSYRLPKIKFEKPYFGILHAGEGNGWDPNRPCLASIILFNNKIYLVDAGPHITHSLKALQIKIKDIDGIFMTHVHDDHFAGLYSLIKDHPNIKIFSAPFVQETIIKKLAALLMISETKTKSLFQNHPLTLDQWNEYNGLQIKPMYSPHPVDTTTFIFKVKGNQKSYTYGHYSDISALSWLKKLLVENSNTPGITSECLQYVKDYFALKLDVKKVDVGGPTIHGDEEDFANDQTERLILAHTTQPLNQRQLEIGKQAQFGEIDVLMQLPTD